MDTLKVESFLSRQESEENFAKYRDWIALRRVGWKESVVN
jgi:hypothetical protein